MKESTSLASILLEQLDQKNDQLLLTENAPVLEFLPPFLLKETFPSPVQDTQFGFCSFPSEERLLEKFPTAVIKRGHPKEVYLFLKGSGDAAFNFDQLGFVYLSRNVDLGCAEDGKLREWLNYALSPELWGPEGKWTRFHERLHNLLEKHKLLEGSSLPGHYPLKLNARSWEKLPIQGDLTSDSYNLVLPWTFSLTDLKKVESLLNGEH